MLEAVGFSDATGVAVTVGLGAVRDGVGDAPGHALPYAAAGKVSGDPAAAVVDPAAPVPSARPGRAAVNCQASNTITVIAPPRMKNRRRQ